MQKKWFIVFAAVVCVMAHGAAAGQSKEMALVEAESFSDKGGWVLDQQFMDQMGSPFLLAHGLGTPVADASTSVALPAKGVWHVWARTWNWCAPWGDTSAPGRFTIKVDGRALPNQLGTGSGWGWEYAGEITAAGRDITLALADQTGFDGRCDAVLFSRRKDARLPDSGERLSALRRELSGLPDKAPSAGQFDLVVAGGGIAGISAAVMAARDGLKVALIHNRPVPGGNNSVELQVVVSGELNCEPFPRLGSIVRQIGDIYRNDAPVLEMLATQENLSYFPNMHVSAVVMRDGAIASLTARHIETGREWTFSAPLFADCTGDANLGHLAGAHYRVGREMRGATRETLAPDIPDNMVLGSTLFWRTTDMKSAVDFPVCDWAIQFNERSCEKATSGHGFWETGFTRDQVGEAEYIRDYMLRAIYGNWAFIKNLSVDKARFANLRLTYIGYIAGKRESRRLVGDVLFTQNDIEGDFTRYNDAIVTGTYPIDQHLPEPRNSFFFPGEEFRSTMKHNHNPMGVSKNYLRPDQINPPYRIPYRCLYSANVPNLFMAGRNASVSHVALASSRVQGTTGMMGEVVGRAAAICRTHGCLPRDVYNDHLEQLLSSFK